MPKPEWARPEPDDAPKRSPGAQALRDRSLVTLDEAFEEMCEMRRGFATNEEIDAAADSGEVHPDDFILGIYGQLDLAFSASTDLGMYVADARLTQVQAELLRGVDLRQSLRNAICAAFQDGLAAGVLHERKNGEEL